MSVGMGGTSLPPRPVTTHCQAVLAGVGTRTGHEGRSGHSIQLPGHHEACPRPGPGRLIVGQLPGTGAPGPPHRVREALGAAASRGPSRSRRWVGVGAAHMEQHPVGRDPATLGRRRSAGGGGGSPAEKQAPRGLWSPRARWLPCRRAGRSGRLCRGVSPDFPPARPSGWGDGGDLSGGCTGGPRAGLPPSSGRQRPQPPHSTSLPPPTPVPGNGGPRASSLGRPPGCGGAMPTPPIGKHTCLVKVTSGEGLAHSHEPGPPASPQPHPHPVPPRLGLSGPWAPLFSTPPS